MRISDWSSDVCASDLSLTDKGEELAATAESAFRPLFDKVDELCQQGAGGILTVSTSPSLAVKWLIPRLGRFYQGHPEVALRIRPDPRVVDLQAAAARIDMAIRCSSDERRVRKR